MSNKKEQAIERQEIDRLKSVLEKERQESYNMWLRYDSERENRARDICFFLRIIQYFIGEETPIPDTICVSCGYKQYKTDDFIKCYCDNSSMMNVPKLENM